MWTLFIGGIMTGFVALWAVVEAIKRDTTKDKESAREINVPEIQEVQVVNYMTDEEFNERMDALFKIFA